MSTVASALAWATERLRTASDTPRLDAELLLAHALGWSRARALAEGRHMPTEAQRSAFRDLVTRRAALEPVAYIVGHKEFYGLDFAVDRRVLVPRPETELLVELALAYARRPTTDDGPLAAISRRSSVVGGRSSLTIVDVGTGSGAIAVALAVSLPTTLVYATDISPDALEVARQNAARHGVGSRVRLLEGDLLDPLTDPVDMIVSNPPYTILGEISEGVRRHEPRLALDGGRDGLDVYRRLLRQALEKLRPGGAILFEIGATQAVAVGDLARAQFPSARIDVHRDLAGLDRVIAIETAGDLV